MDSEKRNVFFLFFFKGCRINRVLKQLPFNHIICNTLSPLPRMQRHFIYSHCMPEDPGRTGGKVLGYLEDKVRGWVLQFKVWTACKQQGFWETICLWSYNFPHWFLAWQLVRKLLLVSLRDVIDLGGITGVCSFLHIKLCHAFTSPLLKSCLVYSLHAWLLNFSYTGECIALMIEKNCCAFLVSSYVTDLSVSKR